jgi:hypothetical protein
LRGGVPIRRVSAQEANRAVDGLLARGAARSNRRKELREGALRCVLPAYLPAATAASSFERAARELRLRGCCHDTERSDRRSSERHRESQLSPKS